MQNSPRFFPKHIIDKTKGVDRKPKEIRFLKFRREKFFSRRRGLNFHTSLRFGENWPNRFAAHAPFVTSICVRRKRDRPKQPRAQSDVVLDGVTAVVRAIRSTIGRRPVVVVERPKRRQEKPRPPTATAHPIRRYTLFPILIGKPKKPNVRFEFFDYIYLIHN